MNHSSAPKPKIPQYTLPLLPVNRAPSTSFPDPGPGVSASSEQRVFCSCNRDNYRDHQSPVDALQSDKGFVYFESSSNELGSSSRANAEPFRANAEPFRAQSEKSESELLLIDMGFTDDLELNRYYLQVINAA